MRRSRLIVVPVLSSVLSVAATVSAGLGDNAVGVNVHDGQQAFIDACADLGVGWIRVDGNWWIMEPSQGTYQWGPMDEAVNAANAAGLSVFMTLAYTPDWVPRHADSDGFSGNDVPNSPAEWSSFVSAAVTHYRALGVRHFGIWNEPNLGGFWEGSLSEYVSTILLPGANAVRASCNDCFVLGPDLANVGECDVYLEDIFAQAPASTFDIFTHHIYQGFPETGVEIWDGDRYFEVLDSQRFPFTRKDIRQILDAAGYQGEVWITETGDRATPIGDVSAEERQAMHVTLALDEQLERGWVTNTFFYEIHDCGPDQPQCTIDGFGLMRATAGTAGNRTFPGDFRLKPAYYALKQYIETHPELAGEPASQCGDGVDNDGDGFADVQDRGCSDSTDDNESDEPPRLALIAMPAGAVTIDGQLSDIGAEQWVDATEWVGTEPLSGSGDLGVRAAARWDDQGLVLAFEVTDDTHDNDNADSELWMGDSVQIAFDIGRDFGSTYDTSDDHEITVALAGGQPRSYRFHGPAGASDAFETAVVREGDTTRYEVRLTSDALPALSLAAGTSLGFSFLVNDADGQGRAGWIEWTPGIGTAKVPYYFGELFLSDGTVMPDAGTGGAGGAGGAGGTAGNGGGSGGADAGTSGGAGGTGSGASGTASQPTTNDDGCGCTVLGRAGDGWPTVLALLLGLRRRRRARGG